MISVNSPFLPPFEEYIAELEKVWDNKYLTNNGPLLGGFRQELSRFLDIPEPNISLFVNGHLALEAGLRALELEGEVITTPFTFASSTNAIVNCGLKPVFCDIDPETLCIDHTKIEDLITEHTSAILAVHVFGNLCNFEEIQKIADKHNLRVVYDAAHAFGIKYKGKSVYSYGDISMASFHATKVFHSIEGGMLCFNDTRLAERLDLIKNFGVKDNDIHLCGSNMKMNEFQAAMGLVNLRYLDHIVIERKKAYNKYLNLLAYIKSLRIVEFKNDSHNFIYFPIVFSEHIDISVLVTYMEESGIQIRRYFYPLTSKAKYFDGMFNSDTPTANSFSERIICLPLYYGIKDSDQSYIIEKLDEFLKL